MLRTSHLTVNHSVKWKDSFNVARGRHDLEDPVYKDPVYEMLERTTKNNHRCISVNHQVLKIMFRIMFGYIRPEL